MRCYISVACVLSVLAAVCLAAPANLEDVQNSELAPANEEGKNVKLDVTESSTSLSGGRSRRNIAFLRMLWPDLFKVIDNVIQNVTGQAFRIIGGAVLRSGGLGLGGNRGGGGDSGGSMVSVVLPTFPPDEFDDDEDEDDDSSNSANVETRIGDDSESNSTNSNPLTVPDNSSLIVNLPIDGEDSLNSIIDKSTTATLSTDRISTDSASNPGVLYTSPVVAEENTVARQIRTARAADDQEAEASAPNPAEDLSNVDAEDADRDKRFLPFGGGDGHSGGGSGNFLFDLIRSTADRAARAVGTVYRMVAGTENLGFGVTATSTSTKTLAAATSQLVAGSGATEETDEKANGPGLGGAVEVDIAKGGDGYTEAIPGPITRLLVVANRGVANLIQDLILRLAQTSERIVNFKARLITALI